MKNINKINILNGIWAFKGRTCSKEKERGRFTKKIARIKGSKRSSRKGKNKAIRRRGS